MFLQKKNKTLLAVCSGESVPTSRIPDDVFSSDMLGKGFAVEPSDSIFYSPADGRIESVAESGHAYTILSEDGLNILVHIGVDTVTLKGDGFEAAVVSGQSVHAGDELCRVDLDKIRQKKLPTITAVIVGNPEALDKIDLTYGKVTGGRDAVMTYRLVK